MVERTEHPVNEQSRNECFGHDKYNYDKNSLGAHENDINNNK